MTSVRIATDQRYRLIGHAKRPLPKACCFSCRNLGGNKSSSQPTTH